MESLEFLRLAWPLLCALVAICAFVVRLQSKINSNCKVTTRLQGHIGELLSFMNRAETTVKNDSEQIARLTTAIEKSIDKNEKTVDRIWNKIEEIQSDHSNRLTAIESVNKT